jgi:hypothetical protein
VRGNCILCNKNEINVPFPFVVGYQLSFVKQPTKGGGINEPCRKSSWVISYKALLEAVDSANAAASCIKLTCALGKHEIWGDYLCCVEGKEQ